MRFPVNFENFFQNTFYKTHSGDFFSMGKIIVKCMSKILFKSNNKNIIMIEKKSRPSAFALDFNKFIISIFPDVCILK